MAPGQVARSLGSTGPDTPGPSTASSVLGVGSAPQHGLGFPFHIPGICTLLTASSTRLPGLQLQREQGERLRGASGTWGNILELAFCFLPLNLLTPRWSGPRGPFPAPSAHHRVACVTTTRNGGALGLPTARTLWSSDLAPPCPSTQPPDSCSEGFPSEWREGTDLPAMWSLLRLVDHGNGPNHNPLQKYQRQSDWQTIFVSHTSQGRTFIPQKTRCLPPVSLRFSWEGEQLTFGPMGTPRAGTWT